MPVVGGVFVPRSPLTPAELHVDWAGTNAHVVSQRVKVERDATAAVRRMAVLAVAQQGITSQVTLRQLEDRLRIGLERTARFGAASAVSEVERLRAHNAALATLFVPDAGRYARVAAQGLAGILALIARRSSETAQAIADTIHLAVRDAAQIPGSALNAAITAGTRALHNRVLELVGESLNLGRTAGALAMEKPPEFALRSEQLDRNTCAPCDTLHGTITTVGSPGYYASLPPSGCLGGGRCRGLEVFGDGPRDVRVPDLIAA